MKTFQTISREYAAGVRQVAADWLRIADQCTDPALKDFALSRACDNHNEAQRVEAQLCVKNSTGVSGDDPAATPVNFQRN